MRANLIESAAQPGLHAILWDSDGVLVDSERVFFEVNRDFYRGHAIELTERGFFDYFLLTNRSMWHLLAGDACLQVDRLRERRNVLYSARLRSAPIVAVSGMPQLLATLSGQVRMAIVTSCRRVHFDLIHQPHDMLRHVEFALTAESYTHSKPSPEPYLAALDRLGVAAEHSVVVEDSPRGLHSAMAAGIRCIVLRNSMTRHCDFAGAYRVVDTVAQLGDEIDLLITAEHSLN